MGPCTGMSNRGQSLEGAGEIFGTVLIYVSPDGHVIATADDFSRAGYGGFTLQRAQEIRCRNKIARAVAEQYASPALAENITVDTADRILQDLLNSGGKLCYHTIQKDVEE